ncbi:methylated-DNA--[protein]-cysteine S-methyltransferase [Crossiella sp. SN42]|uniref:methylated-DNA--[protein]-cysteine S-methyltransferase n=1 Tax=Crossiella sp. SN42 TaxID=2944808 RepID=UPI00207CFB15|nr:methylated-DNA--[protein]-cysteine S-methyltransferase [Crossiella sp. SN42]MCO1575810.1 methylated-DNA--[protein]-cysteine S-methyltransferase [Crossiella sp. SN42]
MRTNTILDSPYGPLTLVAQDGALAGIYMEQQRHLPSKESFGEPDPSAFGQAIEQLNAYFAGELRSFDLPMTLLGTEFQRSVWQLLLEIPYGETATYGELAQRLGNPAAARAVGLANGKNPISIIVPCHRVIGSTGNLTGYGGGLAKKRQLLDFERGQDQLSVW